jgi:hypothetical protein
MKTNNTRKITLRLPERWEECSASDLETVARGILREQEAGSRYRPFDWEKAKMRMVLEFNRLEVIRPADENTMDADGDADITLRMTAPGADSEPFVMRLGQMADLVRRLDWVNSDDGVPPILFPYPHLIGRTAFTPGRTVAWLHSPSLSSVADLWPWSRVWYRPGELLDGMPWQRYRLAGEYMDSWQRTSNAIAMSAARGRRPDPGDVQRQQRDRTGFLAAVFGCETWRTAGISEVQWQVILFWWTGVMKYLMRQYPRCFAKPKPGDKPSQRKGSDPLSIYTRITATMEKHLQGMDEAKVNRETCHNVLQHLDDIAREADEMEKLSRRNKTHH